MNMKLLVALTGLAFGAGLVSASTLRPSVIVHGVIRDTYGLRLGPGSAIVSAFKGTNELARTTVSVQPARSNYRLEINVSDPLTAAAADLVPGDTVTVRVRIGAVTQPTIGPSAFVAPGNGGTVNMNLILGTDSDGDGLPDAWEQMVIANSSGSVSSLSQVGPGRDLDGDGMPDDQEFLYGSFPFLPGDEVRMNALTQHPNGRLSFTLSPIPGVLYWLESSPSLGAPAWASCPASLTLDGALSTVPVAGGDQPLTFFVQPPAPAHFFRLRAR